MGHTQKQRYIKHPSEKPSQEILAYVRQDLWALGGSKKGVFLSPYHILGWCGGGGVFLDGMVLMV